MLLDEKLENSPRREYRSNSQKGMAKLRKKKQHDPLVAELLDELQVWCEQERGRQAQVARALGVNRRRLYDWFSGRISPTLAVGLRIQAFLKLQKQEGK